MARPEFDLGTAPATLPMQRMLLVLKRSPEQESALETLLNNQQDKSSPSYHMWLTPEKFGEQFGPTDADIQTITAWLQLHGFQVGTTKGRTVLEFSGSAGQVQEAFHTTIHKYVVNEEQHWANSSDPSIPTALTPAVAGVLTLHNFIKKPTIHFMGKPVPAKLVPGKKPEVTFPPQNGQPAINALAPSDYAVIYNINPVYDNNVTGFGIRIGVVGRSNLYNNGQDIDDFRSAIGPSYGEATFSVILDGPDPGDLGGGEEAEATLDTTWSGAIAPLATVELVVSATTNTTDGIDLSETYIIENNITDVMTESFSACELYATDAQLAGASALAEQAAAQGITYFVSTGDDGAEGCDDPSTPPATNPISVNYLASTAFNVAVGGTMFNENGNPSEYWTSAMPVSETAISYIPEDVWNESSLTNGLWSGSGGASAGNIQSGVGTTLGVPKPYWQSGVMGIPDDGVRDLPDVSLTAAGHDPYLLCLEGSCVANDQGEFYVYFISGTSASAPSFAGIMALVEVGSQANPGYSTRIGQANYVLYRLAATQSAYPSQCDGSDTSTPPSSSCIFNDVTLGNNVVPGEVNYGLATALYQAGVGYDQTTGLGSVNVANLVDQWNSVTFTPTTTTLSYSPTTAVHGSPVNINITVKPNAGSGTPTGNVALNTGLGNGTSVGFFPLAGGSVSFATSSMPGGNYFLTAQYGGDMTFAPSSSGESAFWITVTPEPSTTAVSVLTANQSGQPIPFTTGSFGSFVYLRADVAGVSGYGVPTGTVTFSDTFGTIPGANAFALNSQGNTATPNGVLTFDTGTHTISASYSGDASFNPSNTTQSLNFTIQPGFFAAIPSNQSVATVSAPGSSGSTSVTVYSSTGFSGTISLACSGLPSGAVCLFSPSSVAANGILTTTSSVITVTTTAATTGAASRSPRLGHSEHWLAAAGFLFLSALLIGGWKHQRSLRCLAVLALAVLLPGCGGGSSSGGSSPPPNPGTATGTYNVTVSASSGTTTSTTGFTLFVE
ncbi:MAG: protease pro-enzyme activation domain-containing protein [Candidatus Sulfotelmatobacter sp.]